MVKVKLEDIIDAMELQDDEYSHYLEKKTGKIELISDDEIRDAECDDDDDRSEPLEWEKERIEVAKKILENEDDFIELPTRYEIHEYRIMEEYIETVPNPKIQELLYKAIRGKGAFRMFKDTAHNYDVIEDWYKYKQEAFKTIAIRWCKDNEIEYSE